MNAAESFEARMAEAEALAKNRPGDPEAAIALALFQTHARRFAEAAALLEPFYREDPGNRRVLEVYSGALFGGARFREAAVPLSRLVALDPANFECRRLLTQSLAAIGYADRAIEVYRVIFAAEPEGFIKYHHYGILHFLAGQPREGERLFRKALEFSPGNSDALVAIAQCKTQLGEVGEAIAFCRKALQGAPGHVPALSVLADLDPEQLPPDACEVLLRTAGARTTPTGQSIAIYFSLGKIHLARGRGEDAFRDFSKANALAKRVLLAKGAPYDHAREMNRFEKIKEIFSLEFLTAGPSAADAGRTPVFIFGLPRSGTTLIEQILSSHPNIHGAGEPKALGEIFLEMEALVAEHPGETPQAVFLRGREDGALSYFARLGPIPASATHVTDKMPPNFPYIGLARYLFPRAKFICVRRDLRDTCVSMFCQPLDDSYPAAVDFEWLGQFCNLFESYLAWWNGLFPGEVLDVCYENVVANPERETRRMLEFVGLPWDPACLGFADNPRVVTTLSNVQVRKPLTADSIGRWRVFEPHLGPLTRSLGALAAGAGK